MQKKLTERHPPHRVLREVYRHYTEFKALFSSTGTHVIEHGYFVYNEDGTIKEKVSVAVSLWDLHNALKHLSKRKREAVFYNVILDWKQKDVAAKMGITTVSVGQYVEQAMLQLSEHYFAEELGEQSSEVNVELQNEREDTQSSISGTA